MMSIYLIVGRTYVGIFDRIESVESNIYYQQDAINTFYRTCKRYQSSDFVDLKLLHIYPEGGNWHTKVLCTYYRDDDTLGT